MELAVAAARTMFRRGAIGALEHRASPNVVIDWSNSIGPYAGTYRGIGEAGRFLASFSEAFEEVEWSASDFVAIGDRLAMATEVSARGAGSGVPGTGRGGQAWTFDGDRIAHIKLFQSRDEAVLWVRQEALAAARLYFVCEARPGGGDPRPILDGALRGGADIIQLRDPDLDDDELVAAAAPFRGAASERGALFILNDRPDLVAACEADGVHVGQDDAPVAVARSAAGPAALVGLSTHSAEQLEAAESGGGKPDQVSVGPVWETPTKPGRPATGLELIRHASERASIPWFAIGGIDAANVGEVAAAGAERIVVVRAIRDADDPESAARTLRQAVERSGAPA
jgi:thiamine-phosphate pyrophosphorylase